MKKVLYVSIFISIQFSLIAQSYSLGDVNHNGSIDIVDALLVAQAYVGSNPANYYAAQADVNCTGNVDIVDALLIARLYVGLIAQLPCQAATPEPTIVTATPGPTVASGLPVPPTSGVPRPAGNPGNLVVINWAGFKGAVSYTFDDANSSQISHFQELQALGVRMTFYIQTNKTEASNSIWSTAFQSGHELGNHTHSHPQTASASDIDQCTSLLQQRFGVTPYTMAAPYGDASYVSPAQTRFLLNRGVAGGSIGPNDSSNPFNLPCHIPATGAQASAMNSVVDSARSAGKWQIVLIHGFTGGTDGAYQPVDIAQFTSTVNHAKSFGDLWIDSALNVGAYWRAQKMLASVSPAVSGNTTTWQWTLPDHFPSGKYLRVKVDGGTLSQGGTPLSWDDHGYYEISLDTRSLTLTP